MSKSKDQQDEQTNRDSRKLTYYQDTDGNWIIHAKLPAEEGALVVKAFEAAADSIRENVSAETYLAVGVLAPAVGEKTGVNKWQGENCDYGMAVEGLLRRDIA